MEGLRDLYCKAYRYIDLESDSTETRTEAGNWQRKVEELDNKLAPYRVLQAKLTVLEDELDRLKEFRLKMERLTVNEPVSTVDEEEIDTDLR